MKVAVRQEKVGRGRQARQQAGRRGTGGQRLQGIGVVQQTVRAGGQCGKGGWQAGACARRGRRGSAGGRRGAAVNQQRNGSPPPLIPGR